MDLFLSGVRTECSCQVIKRDQTLAMEFQLIHHSKFIIYHSPANVRELAQKEDEVPVYIHEALSSRVLDTGALLLIDITCLLK